MNKQRKLVLMLEKHKKKVHKKYEKRETNREASALKAAQVERAIEKELLNRLKVGTFYKDIYNLDKKDFEDQLNAEEVDD